MMFLEAFHRDIKDVRFRPGLCFERFGFVEEGYPGMRDDRIRLSGVHPDRNSH